MNLTGYAGGATIFAEIVAFDRAGNSGEESIQSITLVIDLLPPFMEDAVIGRDVLGRDQHLLPISTLLGLEKHVGNDPDTPKDPRADKQQYVDYYQNGAFLIKGRADERETSIRNISVYIYDWEQDNYELGKDFVYHKELAGGNPYAPEWTIRERDLIYDLKTDDTILKNKNDPHGVPYDWRLNKGERLYFKVYFSAEDEGGNIGWESDFGYFCLFRAADKPKAGLAGGTLKIVSLNMDIPVEVFDDDTLDIAYVDLLTVSQFREYYNPDGADSANDAMRLDVIWRTLEGLEGGIPGKTVYNWRNAKNDDDSGNAEVTNRIKNDTDSFQVSLTAGEKPTDYGDYKLIALIQDKKTEPHDLTNDKTIEKTGAAPATGFYVFDITIADNSAPLIVIDTVNTYEGYDSGKHMGKEDPSGAYRLAATGNSPEENTFPKLDKPDNRYFTIQGYTLDDNSGDSAESRRGYVQVFKMAWVPYGKPGGAEKYVKAVEWALSTNIWTDIPTDQKNDKGEYIWGDLPGKDRNLDWIQHWTLPKLDEAPAQENGYTPPPPPLSTDYTSYFVRGSQQTISGSAFTKQTFKKKFDVLGGPDDLSPAQGAGGVYRNFTYNDGTGDVFENEAKLLMFYAKDIDNHEVYRTIRLLGNIEAPLVKIYDFTTYTDSDPKYNLLLIDDEIRELAAGGTPFNPGVSGSLTPSPSGQAKFYNMIEGVYQKLKAAPPPPGYSSALQMYESFPLQTYPRDKVHKLYVEATGDGGVDINTLKMFYLSAGGTFERGFYHTTNKDLTYVSPLPELMQQTFQFYAENALGTPVRVSRTVAVTATAMLEEINTPLTAGEYGGTTPIRLQARFSSSVKVRTTSTPGSPLPKINLRYEINGAGSGTDPDGKDIPGQWKYTYVEFDKNRPAGILSFLKPAGTNRLESDPTMYLDFYFPIPSDANGRLQTINQNNCEDPGNVVTMRTIDFGNQLLTQDSPVTIIDAARGDPAFLPGKEPSLGYNLTWPYNDKSSLQDYKEIVLDGILPVIENVTVGGKSPYPVKYAPGEAANYYFKSGESITFTIKASKNIRTFGAGNPRIQFQVIPPGSLTPGSTIYYADYLRPGDDETEMLFSRDVTPLLANGNIDTLNCLPDGTIVIVSTGAGININFGLNTDYGTIVDKVGNPLSAVKLIPEIDAAAKIRVDTRIPSNITHTGPSNLQITDPAPITALASTASFSANPNRNIFRGQPLLTLIADPETASEEYWGSIVQYSLDDGLSWVDYPNPRDKWTVAENGKLRISSGEWRLRVRQTDKAGNVSTQNAIPQPDVYYLLDINGTFPKLDSIRFQENSGTHTPGNPPYNNLHIILDFEREVKTNIAGETSTNRAYIVVSDPDINSTVDDNIVTHTRRVYADRQTAPGRSLTFTWRLDPESKQMPKGITISKICLFGDGTTTTDVEDFYGNPGVNSYKAIPFNKISDDNYTYTGSPAYTNTYNGKIIMFKKAADRNSTPNLTVNLNSDDATVYTVDNLNGEEINVYTFPAKLQELFPKSAVDPSAAYTDVPKGVGNVTAAVMGNAPVYSPDRRTITLIFNENIRKEAGTIYVKPHGNFPIPPVFPNRGYVINDPLDPDNGLYVESFNEIYNSPNIDSAKVYKPNGTDTYTPAELRNFLRATTYVNSSGTITTSTATGTNAAVTDTQGKLLTTGLDFGPYKLTTQGLKTGAGYPADPAKALAYNSDSNANKNLVVSPADFTNWNAIGNSYMVPDTASKYVLDYKYPNHENGPVYLNELTGTNASDYTTAIKDAVGNIRKALNAAHFRWQAVDVISSNVKIGPVCPLSDQPGHNPSTCANECDPLDKSKRVTITLRNPLQAGMQWDVYYDEGIFTDEAGIKVSGITEGHYWFWTDKVQKPVIRVDRKSVDYRTGTDRSGLTDWTAGIKGVYNNNTPTAGIGVGVGSIASLNDVSFRVETET
ncbi:MAG: hypothetical protein FWF22_03925, partial [Treponema sp.]|nr:hypothetical protein [Treponema sp.]